MKRDMLQLVAETKRKANKLIRYANPRSKARPTIEEVKKIIQRNIPYKRSGARPVIEEIIVREYHKNPIQKSAHFFVITDIGIFEISVYERIGAQPAEEKECDKTETFPSGLFKIFSNLIV